VLPYIKRTVMTSVSLPIFCAERSAATLNNPSSFPNSLTVESMSCANEAS
jgi:hypothetical protein